MISGPPIRAIGMICNSGKSTWKLMRPPIGRSIWTFVKNTGLKFEKEEGSYRKGGRSIPCNGFVHDDCSVSLKWLLPITTLQFNQNIFNLFSSKLKYFSFISSERKEISINSFHFGTALCICSRIIAIVLSFNCNRSFA